MYSMTAIEKISMSYCVVKMWVCWNIEQQWYIFIGRGDGQPLSDVITLTCNLPFTAAGCDSLHCMVDDTSDHSIDDWSSCASDALLRDKTVHVLTLKEVLASLQQLVSLSLFFMWPVELVESVVVITGYSDLLCCYISLYVHVYARVCVCKSTQKVNLPTCQLTDYF